MQIYGDEDGKNVHKVHANLSAKRPHPPVTRDVELQVIVSLLFTPQDTKYILGLDPITLR